jgi:Leucine-rich repeat (LRR) protein
MEGKLEFFQSVRALRLHSSDAFSGHLEELRSMPSLKSLQLSSRYAERAVDATALCSLTGLISLRLDGKKETVLEGVGEEEVGEWVLELGGFTMLKYLDLRHSTVTDAEVLAVGTLTALTTLNLFNCVNVTDVAVGTLSDLTGLTGLNLGGCLLLTDVGVGTLSGFTALTKLSLSRCRKLTDVAVGTLSGFTGLTELGLGGCRLLTDVGVSSLSSLTALSTLYLRGCPNVTAAGKQALRTASPNLTIVG